MQKGLADSLEFVQLVREPRPGNSLPPLFLVHDGIEDHKILQIASHIEGEFPIYTLSALVSHQFQTKTIEGVARLMASTIHTIQRDGPFYIVGYSLGGVVAYELATYLTGEDLEIAFLGLIDTQYEFGGIVFQIPISEKLRNSGKQTIITASDEAVPDYKQYTEPYDTQIVAATNGYTTWSGGIVDETLSCHPINLTASAFSPSDLVHWRELCVAVTQYSAQKLPIRVHFFSSRKSSIEGSFQNWNCLSRANSDTHEKCPNRTRSEIPESSAEFLGQALSRMIQLAAGTKLEIPERKYNPLVVLQNGRRSESPFILVPGAGATVASFAELVVCLDISLPINGLEPRGLDGVLVPHSTVRAAAQSYLAVINERYPAGGLHLFGHSFGGWVVFEMAQQLEDAGRTVSSLTILDSDVPNGNEDICEYTSLDALMECVAIFELILERPLGIRRHNIEHLNETAQREVLHECLMKEGLLPRRTKPDVLCGPLRTFATSLRTKYKPDRAYLGKVGLILVDHPQYGDKENRERHENTVVAWRKWAPNLFYSHAMGNHLTILKSPHVSALGYFLDQIRE